MFHKYREYKQKQAFLPRIHLFNVSFGKSEPFYVMNSLKNFFLKYIKQFDEGTVFYSKETTVKNHIELYWWSSLKDQTYCLSFITLVTVDISNFSAFRLVD